jgi:hypothetical protein
MKNTGIVVLFLGIGHVSSLRCQPSLVFTGTGCSFSEIKLPESEADFSRFSAEVKNEWSYTSTYLYAFMESTETALNFSRERDFTVHTDR